MKRLNLLLIILLSTPIMAQIDPCGTTIEDGLLIRDRLMENRRTVSPADISAIQNSRSTTYIPVKFTVVGDNSGNGYVNIDNLLAMFCDMNADYADQNICFYMKADAGELIRYRNNSTVYNNGASSSASLWMVSNKILPAVNIFTSASVQNAVASYYTGLGDYVFVLNQQVDGGSSTGSHEVGHFFTLNHTFFGWENTDVTNFEPNNAPNSVTNGGQSFAVERESRTTGNCGSAADGFCDTPADYVSFRASCPYSGGVKDPTGVAIDPDESNIMSYYLGSCVNSFTTEQKAAISADISSRAWTNFAQPSPNGALTGTSITANSPSNGASVPLNGDITIDWSPVANAYGYVVFVERTLFGTPIETVLHDIVYGQTTYTIPASMLDEPREYSWKVKPINQTHACGAYSPTNSFTTSAATGGTAVTASFNERAELRILSNPVSASTVEALINVPEALTATVQLFGLDGRLLANMENVELLAGDNVQLLDISSLNNGIYMMVVSTEKGNLHQKIVVSR